MTENESKNCCESCWGTFEGWIDDFKIWYDEKKDKIAGRLGMVLSILNIAFIGLDAYYPTSIAKYVVASLVSVGVFIGGVMFEKLVNSNKILTEDNKSKNEMIRRYTQFGTAFGVMPRLTTQAETPDNERHLEREPNGISFDNDSISSIEPVNFLEVHKNNE